MCFQNKVLRRNVVLRSFVKHASLYKSVEVHIWNATTAICHNPVDTTIGSCDKLIRCGNKLIRCCDKLIWYDDKIDWYCDDDVFVVWLTDGRCLALFPVGTIVRDPHHRKSPTRRQSLSWGLVKWSCAEVITTTPRRHNDKFIRSCNKLVQCRKKLIQC